MIYPSEVLQCVKDSYGTFTTFDCKRCRLKDTALSSLDPKCISGDNSCGISGALEYAYIEYICKVAGNTDVKSIQMLNTIRKCKLLGYRVSFGNGWIFLINDSTNEFMLASLDKRELHPFSFNGYKTVGRLLVCWNTETSKFSVFSRVMGAKDIVEDIPGFTYDIHKFNYFMAGSNIGRSILSGYIIDPTTNIKITVLVSETGNRFATIGNYSIESRPGTVVLNNRVSKEYIVLDSNLNLIKKSASAIVLNL